LTRTTATRQKTYIIVNWDYEGPVGAVKLEYRNGTNGWELIGNNIDNWRKYTWKIGTPPPSNQYQLRISAVDNPAVFDTSDRFTILDSTANLPPTLQPLPDSIVVKKNQLTSLTIRATDPDKDTIKFTYSTLASWATAKDSVLTFAPASGSATITLTVTVSDGKGGTAVDSVKVIVDATTGSGSGQKPRYGLPPEINIVRSPTTLSLTSAFSTTIRCAELYSLAGKKTGEFSESMGRFTLTCAPGASTTTVSILRVRFMDAAGNTTTISRVLLW
jgi:hypothetical protein